MWSFPTVNPHISSPFLLSRRNPDGTVTKHLGVDFEAGNGEPILAVDDGEVTLVHLGEVNLLDNGIEKTPQNQSGNYVFIKHANGYASSYSHLSASLVAKGTKVIQGQQIGLAGNTGYSFGAHLHFASLRLGKNGYEFFDPIAAMMFAVEKPSSGMPNATLAIVFGVSGLSLVIIGALS